MKRAYPLGERADGSAYPGATRRTVSQRGVFTRLAPQEIDVNWKDLTTRRRISAPWVIVLLAVSWILFVAVLIATGPVPAPAGPAQ